MTLADMLTGGDPRSLGNTEKVVDHVLANRALFDELFDCLFSDDEIVRMRAGDALEKICRQQPKWLEPYVERLFKDVSKIRQASVQWHLAQILSEIDLNQAGKLRAIEILKQNLASMNDWIVVNVTLESLATFVRLSVLDREEFVGILKKHQNSDHKSVQSRVNKLLKEFENA